MRLIVKPQNVLIKSHLQLNENLYFTINGSTIME